MCPE